MEMVYQMADLEIILRLLVQTVATQLVRPRVGQDLDGLTRVRHLVQTFHQDLHPQLVIAARLEGEGLCRMRDPGTGTFRAGMTVVVMREGGLGNPIEGEVAVLLDNRVEDGARANRAITDDECFSDISRDFPINRHVASYCLATLQGGSKTACQAASVHPGDLAREQKGDRECGVLTGSKFTP
jgi:hypothetical protein